MSTFFYLCSPKHKRALLLDDESGRCDVFEGCLEVLRLVDFEDPIGRVWRAPAYRPEALTWAARHGLEPDGRAERVAEWVSQYDDKDKFGRSRLFMVHDDRVTPAEHAWGWDPGGEPPMPWSDYGRRAEGWTVDYG